MSELAVVQKYREIFKDLSGEERAGKITNAVATELGAGWGLISKSPGETQWEGRSIDAMVNPNGRRFVDILQNSETVANPAWQEREATASELAKWIKPLDTYPSNPNPPDPEVPNPPVTDNELLKTTKDILVVCTEIRDLLKAASKLIPLL